MAAPSVPFDDGTFTLGDGRQLRWAQWGVPRGKPVLFLHGNPGSRLFRLDETALQAAEVALVTVDRPGLGESSPRPERRIVDWAADVAELVEGFGFERIGVVGVAMGGPHALACGASLPGMIATVAVYASPGPWGEPGFEALTPPPVREMRDAFARHPLEAEHDYRQAMAGQRRGMLDQPTEALQVFLSRLAGPDQRLLDDDAMHQMLREDFAEGLRNGVEGFFEERMAGYVLEWGFRLTDVQVPVTVLQPREAAWLPNEVGEELARRLPHGRLRELHDVGHFPPWSVHGELIGW